MESQNVRQRPSYAVLKRVFIMDRWGSYSRFKDVPLIETPDRDKAEKMVIKAFEASDTSFYTVILKTYGSYVGFEKAYMTLKQVPESWKNKEETE